MSERILKKDQKDTPVTSEREGFFEGWVTTSAELAEGAVAQSFNIARDVRTEVAQRVLASIDYIEATQVSLFRLARSVVQRVDGFAQQSLEAGENISIGMVRLVRDTGHGATDAASRAASALTKKSEKPQAVRAA